MPDHDTFYYHLTSCHAAVSSAEEQQVLRRATVLIAGCESVGCHAGFNLARAGIERFLLSDERIGTIHRLPRLIGGTAALGENCATTAARQIASINPFANIVADDNPLDFDEIVQLMSGVTIVIDALGCETSLDFRSRLTLHQAANSCRIPVITGFDIGTSAWTLFYDYRDGQQEILDGAYSEADVLEIDEATPIPLLMNMVSLSHTPVDLLKEADRILRGQRDDVPHSPAASSLAGGIISQVVTDVLLDRPVRRMVAVDLNESVRPSSGLRGTGRRLVAFYSLRRHLRSRRREGRVGVFSPLEDDVFKDLRPYMEERAYEAGSVIVRQGDPAGEFFVIVDGRVHVEHEERDDAGEPVDFTIIAELGPGDYFGEMALLSDSTRTASVVVTERCRVLVLSRGAFEIYLEESGAAANKVRDEALARLQDNRATIGC